MRAIAVTLLLCAFAGCASTAPSASAPGFLVYTQHRGSDGAFWYRTEAGPMPAAQCRAALKKITTRQSVGFTKWYDTTPAALTQAFGKSLVQTHGTWIACWPDGTDLGLPDS